MSLSLDDAKAAKDEAQSGNLRENDAGIPDDLYDFDYEEDEAPIAKIHPETFIAFDGIVDYGVFNTDDDFLDKRQNLEGAGEYGYGNQAYLLLKNPTLINGEIWEEDHEFRDIRVVGNLDDDNTPYSVDSEVEMEDGEVVDTEVTGVDLGMGGFDGERTEGGFDTEYVQILISSRRASDILGVLDTAGKRAIDNGVVQEGIIEVPPELEDSEAEYDPETHGAPRAVGYPSLRADMVGQEGAITAIFGDDEPSQTSPVEVDVYRVDGDDMETLVPLTPDDEAFAKPEYPRAGNLYWDHDTDGGQDFGADAEPDNSGGVAEAKAQMSSEPSYDDLGGEAQDFVDETVEMIEKMDDPPEQSVTEIGDWDEHFATNTAGEGVEADKETIETIIDSNL